MTIEQTKRRIPVMQKFGEPGWRIECLHYNEKVWRVIENPAWDYGSTYRAVRFEKTPGKRVPLPWSTVKCGMTIRDEADKLRKMTVLEMSDTTLWCGRNSCRNRADFTSNEYLDGNEWKPLWTEVSGGERIVEVVSEDEVRFPASKEGII